MPEEKPDTSAANPQNASRKYAGKYDSAEELERAYNNQFVETQKIIGSKTRAEQERDALKAILNSTGVDAGSAHASNRGGGGKGARERLGDDADAIEQLVNEQLFLALKPITESMAAEQVLEGKYPGFASKKSEMIKYLQGDAELWQEYNDNLQKDPRLAQELGFVKFQASELASAASRSASGAEHNSQARNDSRLTGSAGGKGSTEQSVDEAVARRQAAIDKALDGDIGDFLDDRIGNIPSVKKMIEGREQ